MKVSTFHDRAEALMIERGFNRRSLSEAAGMNPRAMKDIFDRPSFPKVDNAEAIANALGTSLAYLIGETDDPEPSAPLRTARGAPPLTVRKVGAGAILDSEALALSLETDQLGEVGFLLSEGEALILRERLDRALRDLSDSQRKMTLQSAS